MKFKVREQKLEIESPDIISEGAINFVTFELECDESWHEFTKTVRFSHSETGEVYDVADVKEGQSYYIPAEVMVKGRVFVGVLGVFAVEHVATTNKAFFTVDEAIERGKTPSVTTDAYAKYVNDVTEQRRVCEEARTVSEECRDECRRMKADADTYARAAVLSEQKSKKMLEEISGMLDAVGVVFHDIRKIEERLASIDGMLSKCELKREGAERARVISDNKRSHDEEMRKNAEALREAAESARATAEKVRALGEIQREKKLGDLSARIDALENLPQYAPRCINAFFNGNGSLKLDDDTVSSIEKITFSVSDATSENHAVRFALDGTEYELYLSQPLRSLSGTKDEIVLSANRELSVMRRNASVTISPDASFFFENAGETRMMYVTDLVGEAPMYESGDGYSTVFSYGSDSDTNCVWISGEYVFFNLDKNQFPTPERLIAYLKENPLTLIYPCLTPRLIPEGSISVPDFTLPLEISFDGEITLECKKDIFKTLEKIFARLEIIEKENKNDNTQKTDLA